MKEQACRLHDDRSLFIERTSYAEDVFRSYMGINHRGMEVLLAEEFLYRPDIVAVFKKVGGRVCTEACFAMPAFLRAS